MSVTANFGSFFGQPVSNRNQFAPTGFNMPAVQPRPNFSPFPMMGGMQFPFTANGGATNLANSIMGRGEWNPNMGLGQGTFVNPFNGYSIGKQPNMPNFSMAGLMGASNEVQILALLQRFLESQQLFSPQKPNAPIAQPITQPIPQPIVKPDVPKMPVLSGKGTIQGDSFKSADGETYTLDLKAGKNYNLLSDTGVGLNGRYAVMGADATDPGQLGLSDVALQINGCTVTFDNEGYLEIDGKKFSKTNDLGGMVKRNSNGSYTIDTPEYDFTLSKDSQRGIRVAVNGTNVLKDGVAPTGLWGSSFDGEVETSREIRRSITEKEFELERLKEFDYEEHNNIGAKSAKGSDPEKDLEKNLDAWLNKEVSYATGTGTIGSGTISFTGDDGSNFDSVISKLKTGKIYNLFSDEGIQVGGRFAQNTDGKNIATEYGFYVDGRRAIITKDAAGSLKVNGAEPTAADIAAGISKNAAGEIVVKTNVGGEEWSFTVNGGTAETGLNLAISGKEIGSNDTRTSGLWGELMGNRNTNAAAELDADGAGYIRNEQGELTSLKDADITSALATYELSSYSDTEGGWSNYEGH
jgi:hypothetical protein